LQQCNALFGNALMIGFRTLAHGKLCTWITPRPAIRIWKWTSCVNA